MSSIDNMPAGPECDRIIAERVMGWNGQGELHGPPPGDRRENWAAEWNKDGWPDWLPKYSTEIADAWEVVEHVGGLELTHILDSTHDFWLAEFAGNGEATAATAPLAICRAAYKAQE